MNCKFDITTSNTAYEFFTDVLNFNSDELVMEYVVKCERDSETFWERNKSKIAFLDLNELTFVAFHVVGSLDDCHEIIETGIQNLQYVLSNDTMLNRFLKNCNIAFDIKHKKMYIDGTEFNVDYNYYKGHNEFEVARYDILEPISHRLYYDYCVDGFFYNDDIEGYGGKVHERPEFLNKLIELSNKAERLEEFWKGKSKPYMVKFGANLNQICKFNFDIEQNNLSYSDEEKECVKRWMVMHAVDRAFGGAVGEEYIYIRDDSYVRPEQILSCEIIDLKNN